MLPTKGSVINQKVAGESAAVAGMVDGGRVEKCWKKLKNVEKCWKMVDGGKVEKCPLLHRADLSTKFYPFTPLPEKNTHT